MAPAPDRQAFVAIFVSQDVVQTVTWATQPLIQRADQNTIAKHMQWYGLTVRAVLCQPDVKRNRSSAMPYAILA
jgi:hypothetical protein